MEDLHFVNKRQFNKFMTESTKFSYQGVEGTTYRRGNLVIKDFGEKPKIGTDHVLQFRDIKLEDFYFPQAGIYIRKKLRACITEYAPGLSLYERNVLCEYVKIILKAVKRLENAIKLASKEKIRLSDVNNGNVIFDGSHFNFIDTISYYYSPLDYKYIFKLNIEHVMRNIYKKILPKKLTEFELHTKGKDAMLNFPYECLEELYLLLESLLGQFQSFEEAEEMIEKQKVKLL